MRGARGGAQRSMCLTMGRAEELGEDETQQLVCGRDEN